MNVGGNLICKAVRRGEHFYEIKKAGVEGNENNYTSVSGEKNRPFSIESGLFINERVLQTQSGGCGGVLISRRTLGSVANAEIILTP